MFTFTFSGKAKTQRHSHLKVHSFILNRREINISIKSYISLCSSWIRCTHPCVHTCSVVHWRKNRINATNVLTKRHGNTDRWRTQRRNPLKTTASCLQPEDKSAFCNLVTFHFLKRFFFPFFSLFTLCNKQDNLQSKKKNRPRWATDSVLSDLQNVNVPLNKTNPHQSLDRLDFSQTYQRSYCIIDSENSDSQNML